MKIDIAEGQIKLGGDLLPGAVQSVSIGGHAIIDKLKPVSGEIKKQLYGFKPSDLSIELLLDSYDDLATLEDLFKYSKKGGLKGFPKKYSLNSFHARARRLREVVFADLESREDNRNDLITVTLNFEEFCPLCAKAKDGAMYEPPAGTAEGAKGKNKKPTDSLDTKPFRDANDTYFGS